MKSHSFHFRCKACNRLLNNTSRKSSDGIIREPNLCSICTSLAFDNSPEREYQHQQITDDFIFNDKEESCNE